MTSRPSIPVEVERQLWNDRTEQIDISMPGKLVRHWDFQRTVSIMSVIAGFAQHTTISVGIMALFG